MSSSLFIKYGVKAGGGAAFLKRTREAVPQPQARTRTGTTSSQVQQRTRTGSVTTTTVVTGSYRVQSCYQSGFSNNYGSYSACAANCSQWGCQSADPYACANQFRRCVDQSQTTSVTCDGSGQYTTWQCYWYSQDTYSTTTSCNFSGWSAWSNVSSCSPTSPGCSNGAVQRECQTLTLCDWSSYSDWSDVSSCTPSSPACSNGAVETQCQTVYNWGDWSAYEEADICVTQSPELGEGAIQTECIPQ